MVGIRPWTLLAVMCFTSCRESLRLECTRLHTKWNAHFLKWRMSSLLHKPGLQFYASFGNSSLLQVLMSDTVSYRLSCGKILKNQVNRDLPHLTCLIHPLHHLCVNICSMFPEANTLAKNGKMIFLKSPLCVTLWKQSTDLPLPPKSFVTHWTTWLETLLWYFKQLYAFATAVNTLDP